jgi:hypothetical protein
MVILMGKKDIWLVVSTPLKNISQWEGLSHILWKIKNVPNHQPDMFPTTGVCLLSPIFKAHHSPRHQTGGPISWSVKM